MNPLPLHARANAGMTLVELMVAVSILGILAIAGSAILVNQGRVAAHVNERMFVSELRSSILGAVDCASTYEAVCKRHERRLYSTTRALRVVGARYADMKGVGRETALRVACEGGAVTVQYRQEQDGKPALDKLTEKRARFRNLFTGPLCVDRTAQTKKCPAGKGMTSFDFDTGRVQCRR